MRQDNSEVIPENWENRMVEVLINYVDTNRKFFFGRIKETNYSIFIPVTSFTQSTANSIVNGDTVKGVVIFINEGSHAGKAQLHQAKKLEER